jgi:hypothetical protein
MAMPERVEAVLQQGAVERYVRLMYEQEDQEVRGGMVDWMEMERGNT